MIHRLLLRRDVPSLDEANPDFAKLSIREQLEVHRDKESCASCHRDIDPWGIALENFDAVGHWRENDAADVLPDGTQLSGADGLRKYLVEHRSEQFARALVRSLMTYALGRSLELIDEAEVNEIAGQLAEDQFRLRPLIQRIVASEAFGTK